MLTKPLVAEWVEIVYYKDDTFFTSFFTTEKDARGWQAYDRTRKNVEAVEVYRIVRDNEPGA